MPDRGISLQTGRCVTNHGPRSYTFHCLDLLNLAKDKEDFFFALFGFFFLWVSGGFPPQYLSNRLWCFQARLYSENEYESCWWCPQKLRVCVRKGAAALCAGWPAAAMAVSRPLWDTTRALSLAVLLRRGHILFYTRQFSGLKHCSWPVYVLHDTGLSRVLKGRACHSGADWDTEVWGMCSWSMADS